MAIRLPPSPRSTTVVPRSSTAWSRPWIRAVLRVATGRRRAWATCAPPKSAADRVEDARNVLKEGDEVSVMIVNVDRKARNDSSCRSRPRINADSARSHAGACRQTNERENAGTTSLGALLRAKLDKLAATKHATHPSAPDEGRYPARPAVASGSGPFSSDARHGPLRRRHRSSQSSFPQIPQRDIEFAVKTCAGRDEAMPWPRAIASKSGVLAAFSVNRRPPRMGRNPRNWRASAHPCKSCVPHFKAWQGPARRRGRRCRAVIAHQRYGSRQRPFGAFFSCWQQRQTALTAELRRISSLAENPCACLSWLVRAFLFCLHSLRFRSTTCRTVTR